MACLAGAASAISCFVAAANANAGDNSPFVPAFSLFDKCQSYSYLLSNGHDYEMCTMKLDNFRNHFGSPTKEDANIVTIDFILINYTTTNESGVDLSIKMVYEEAWDCVDKEVVSRTVYEKAFLSDGSLYMDRGNSWWQSGRGYLLPTKRSMPEAITNLASKKCTP